MDLYTLMCTRLLAAGNEYWKVSFRQHCFFYDHGVFPGGILIKDDLCCHGTFRTNLTSLRFSLRNHSGRTWFLYVQDPTNAPREVNTSIIGRA